MLDRIVDIIVILLGVHALLKFAFFFVLPYARRRAMLDKSYAGRTTATAVPDAVSLIFTIALAGLILVRGIEAMSFLAGLWIGATLIQLYFHRFHAPLAPDEAPPEPVSPIKTLSYAIQAAPGRPWRELTMLTILIGLSIILIARDMIG